MIKKELKKELNVLKSKKEDEIDLLEWRLRMEKILMKDNNKDEYFQYMELDTIKKKSKQDVDKINELIEIKGWNITGGDAIFKLKDYNRDIQEELRKVKIKFKMLKVSKKGLYELYKVII